MSDNGRHFDSEVFRAFAVSWGFGHATSSPHFPQSSGFIERTIQTVKKHAEKAKNQRQRPAHGYAVPARHTTGPQHPQPRRDAVQSQAEGQPSGQGP